MRFAPGLIASLASFSALALACGETATNSDPGGGAGQAATAGSSAAGTTSSGGSGAGTTGSGGSSAGTSSTAGTVGNGGSGSGGSTAGTNAGGSAAGGSAAGGSAALVDCDPHKVLCRVATPDCPQGEVPSVEGTCYGDCVKIDRCSCTSADQCPEPEQFTCLKGPMHCSYYLK